MLHIIVTGPESTGKTTLSRQLAADLGGVWIPEYPRGYLMALDRQAVLADFTHFALVNQQLVAAAKRQNPPFIIQDTGAEVLALWLLESMNAQKHEAVRLAFAEQAPDLYLLAQPDLTWEPDPLRQDGHRRDELFATLRELLASQDCPVVEVSGQGPSRAAAAHKAIAALQ